MRFFFFCGLVCKHLAVMTKLLVEFVFRMRTFRSLKVARLNMRSSRAEMALPLLAGCGFKSSS